jgi:HJR/Mrr/RecB family endonuclease
MKRIGTVIVFSLLAICCSAAPSSQDDMELARLLTIEQVDRMHGLTFEAYVCKLLQSQGYAAENIRASNDYGVDVIASKGKERIAIQIKRSKNPINRSAVSDAGAGKDYYKCSKAMLITNSRLTDSAREFARGIFCVTVERDDLLAWIEKFKQGTKRHSSEPDE